MTDDPITLPPLLPIDDYLPKHEPRWTTVNFAFSVRKYAEDYARAAVLADRAARDKDAERYRWLRQYLAVGRDEPKDWTCWIELPCIPYRSRTTKAEELLDALIARFPLGGPDDPHVCDAAMEKDK